MRFKYIHFVMNATLQSPMQETPSVMLKQTKQRAENI